MPLTSPAQNLLKRKIFQKPNCNRENSMNLTELEGGRTMSQMRRAYSVDNYQKLENNGASSNGRPLSYVDTEVRNSISLYVYPVQ